MRHSGSSDHYFGGSEATEESIELAVSLNGEVVLPADSRRRLGLVGGDCLWAKGVIQCP